MMLYRYNRIRRVAVLAAALTAGILRAEPALAQRADENAVTAAEDAFGTSIGRETIGLYDSSNVRGFSPTAAGNIRIDGMYFDQVWSLSSRLQRSRTIRVGISAQGYPFPAPTGIVDYAFRTPGEEAQLGVLAGIDSYGFAFVEADAVVPLVDKSLALGLGGSLTRADYYNGTDAIYHNEAVSLRWTPRETVEIVPYWQRSDGYDDETGPIYIPAGPYLPPRIERRRFDGPQWADYRGVAVNYGAMARYNVSSNWIVRGGLFRSLFDDKASFSHLLTDLTPDGAANRLIIADPPIKIASTSGELRVTRSITDGPRLHLVHVNLRARDRTRRYDGSDAIDFGPTRIGQPFPDPEPAFEFGEQTRDLVRQWTAGLAYEGRWRDVGELGFSVQRTDYRKRIEQPGLDPAETEARPWLYNISAAAYLTDRLAIYGGYTRGLEESGVAPENAINRNEALPAILTSQRDIGLRYALRPDLRIVAGLFDVRKPYFNLDADDRFDLLGDVEHQGVELSLAGSLTPRLSIVAGAVLLRARVTGEGVALGRVGSRPVGQTDRRLELNLDWRAPVEGLSFDLSASHSGDIVATTDNLVEIPSRTLVDLGGRYRFRFGANPATLRLSLTNVFNIYGYDLQGSGAYDYIPGRVLSAYLAVDF